MVSIPVNMNTTEYVMENRTIPSDVSKRRGYLGMSGLGNKCERALWYGFHFMSPPEDLPIRTRRIFNRGDLEEARIIAELKEVGMEVYKEVDGERIEIFGHIGEEQEHLVGFAGHAAGHPDGRVLGVIEAPKTPHLLEIKTAKASKFKEYIKHKSVEKVNPVYYGQCQRYMSKMKLKRALFIVTNKDTEERYYERVYFNEDHSEELQTKEIGVIVSDRPPAKLSHNKNWLDCKWCNHKGVCHNNEIPVKNCRSCAHADIADAGEWHCSNKNNKVLSIIDQNAACLDYSIGWGV